ncbi:MAG: LytTR family transcriptional regulator DNA-binding domain-containing protein [Bacteroidota bacterium]
MTLKNYLNQPFPKLTSRWKLIITISLFVAIFLIIFQPFGIHLIQNKILILSGYGLVTFLVLFINLIVVEHLFPKTFSEKKWTIGKEFLWLLWIIFCIGLGNALYTNYLFDYFRFNLMFFVQFQLITLTIGLIPTSILIITKQKYLLQRNIKSAQQLNNDLKEGQTGIFSDSLVRIYSDNERDYIEFNPNDFYFIESSGNYIEIYITENNQLIRKTLRCTLKRAMFFLKNISEIVRCHRAYIVNSAKITSAKGNSQGLKLHLDHCETEVPVSRNYVDCIRTQIDR